MRALLDVLLRRLDLGEAGVFPLASVARELLKDDLLQPVTVEVAPYFQVPGACVRLWSRCGELRTVEVINAPLFGPEPVKVQVGAVSAERWAVLIQRDGQTHELVSYWKTLFTLSESGLLTDRLLQTTLTNDGPLLELLQLSLGYQRVRVAHRFCQGEVQTLRMHKRVNPSGRDDLCGQWAEALCQPRGRASPIAAALH